MSAAYIERNELQRILTLVDQLSQHQVADGSPISVEATITDCNGETLGVVREESGQCFVFVPNGWHE